MLAPEGVPEGLDQYRFQLQSFRSWARLGWRYRLLWTLWYLTSPGLGWELRQSERRQDRSRQHLQSKKD